MTLPTLDLNNALATALETGGIDPGRLEEGGDLQARFAEAQRSVEELRDAGRLGFLDLPFDAEMAAQVTQVAESFGQWFNDVVVLGIGGSGLGAVALREALLPPGWNELDDEAREYHPRLHIIDNPDPRTVGPLLDRVDPRRALFVVISKSGSTAETLALYLVARERVARVVDPDQVRGHFLFITDPDRGPLRELSRADEIPTLPVPPAVGGRFSVLSPVGLLPAAICGIDVEGLLAGAARMVEQYRSTTLRENPAGALATVLWAADRELGHLIHVVMPYTDRLRAFALWFQQLWAESLGKIRGEEHVGPTPLPAVGATDQHAQLQLFMEGPRDKIIVFLSVAPPPGDLVIPDLHPSVEAMAYLGGATLGTLLDVERRATTEALRRRSRPSVTLEVASLDAPTVGALILLFEIATVQAGALYGVDPLDQPGVELGKRLTYGLMGRSGHDGPHLPTPDPRWRIGGSSR